MNRARTARESYTSRLQSLQEPKWKRWLDVQRPYRWNLRRLGPGRTLDIGCGIGRCLEALPQGSVGIDHNPHSIAVLRTKELQGFLADDFRDSSLSQAGSFDSLLLAHVLEHMPQEAGEQLLREYLPLLRPGGLVILICPQERGFASDETHVCFYNADKLHAVLSAAGLSLTKSYSFPLPRWLGKLFAYNEFVVVGVKPG